MTSTFQQFPLNEIWVKNGTYYPTSTTDRTISFELVRGVAIYGGFSGVESRFDERDAVSNSTILSGDLNGDDMITGTGSTLTFANNAENTFHVFVTANLTSATIIDGFSIIRANANVSGVLNYGGNVYLRNVGGGFYNNISSPTLTNLRIAENYGELAGAMYNSQSQIHLTNSLVVNNLANNGGGLVFQAAGDTLLHTTIVGNRAMNNDGGISNRNSKTAFLTTISQVLA